MPRMFQARRWNRPVLVGVILHVLFLVTTPFEHHDLLCHLKTPLHCTACASSQLSSDPHPPVIPGAASLPDAGRAVAVLFAGKGAVLAAHPSGRSPPAITL